ncbi:Hypothetical predicted protein [Marmota monax]|uniref:Uncharacterized protein n=1 Tax=Marmota monax TaxID=9995 RepID=A0A5E4D1Z3_MARMO|nr:Hypothetical predicted protein [Marmota monax]
MFPDVGLWSHALIADHDGIWWHGMAISHCVWLMLIAMGNDLKEVWIAEHLILLVTCLWQYIPTLFW